MARRRYAFALLSYAGNCNMLERNKREGSLVKVDVSATRAIPVSKEVANFKRAAEAYLKKAISSRKTANATLVSLGIYDIKGKLKKKYSR